MCSEHSGAWALRVYGRHPGSAVVALKVPLIMMETTTPC